MSYIKLLSKNLYMGNITNSLKFKCVVAWERMQVLVLTVAGLQVGRLQLEYNVITTYMAWHLFATP